jgi:hypothetical protein
MTTLSVLPSETMVDTPTKASSLVIEVRPSSAREECLALWRQLEARIGERGLTCSADWTDIWLSIYGDLVPCRFLIARDERTERVVGLCLITEGVEQTDGPVKVRTLHLGTSGEPDADCVWVEYNRLMVEPELEAAFAQKIVEYLQAQRGFDQWQLDGIAEPELKLFQQLDPMLRVRTEIAHWFDLTIPRARGTDVVTELKKDPRRQARKSLDSCPGLSVEWSRSVDHAADIFGEMRELHQARWNAAGHPGCYASERFTRFHEALLARMVPDGRVAFVRARCLNGTVGAGQLLFDGNRAMLYQRGWSADICHSPGMVIDVMAMTECLRRGVAAFDFLNPASQHKRHLSNASSTIHWAVHRHPRFKFLFLDQGRRVKRWLKGKS